MAYGADEAPPREKSFDELMAEGGDSDIAGLDERMKAAEAAGRKRRRQEFWKRVFAGKDEAARKEPSPAPEKSEPSEFERLAMDDMESFAPASETREPRGEAGAPALAEALAESPLDRLDGVSEAAAKEFGEAREAFFGAYYERATSGKEPKRFKKMRAAYNAALTELAFEMRGGKRKTDAFAKDVPAKHSMEDENGEWKNEIIDALVVGEQERLAALWEAGKGERPKRAAKEAARSPWAKRVLLGFAAGAVLAGDMREVETEPKFRTEDARGAEAERTAAQAPAEEAEEARIAVAPVEASADGANQMLLDMLKKLKAGNAEEQAAYERLAGSEKPIAAAERIAQETGLWGVGDANFSAAIHAGDELRVDERGDLVYVTLDDEEHRLTEDGKALKQDWVRHRS